MLDVPLERLGLEGDDRLERGSQSAAGGGPIAIAAGEMRVGQAILRVGSVEWHFQPLEAGDRRPPGVDGPIPDDAGVFRLGAGDVGGEPGIRSRIDIGRRRHERPNSGDQVVGDLPAGEELGLVAADPGERGELGLGPQPIARQQRHIDVGVIGQQGGQGVVHGLAGVFPASLPDRERRQDRAMKGEPLGIGNHRQLGDPLCVAGRRREIAAADEEVGPSGKNVELDHALEVTGEDGVDQLGRLVPPPEEDQRFGPVCEQDAAP